MLEPNTDTNLRHVGTAINSQFTSWDDPWDGEQGRNVFFPIARADAAAS